MGAGSFLTACQRDAYGPAATDTCNLPPPAPVRPWVLVPPALLPASPRCQHLALLQEAWQHRPVPSSALLLILTPKEGAGDPC